MQTPTPRTRRAEARPIGQELLARGLLDDDRLRWALDAQRRTGARLGTILVAAGLVRRLELYRALADVWGCSFVNLLETPLDASLARRADPRRMIEEGWVPVRTSREGLLVATAEPPASALPRVREVFGDARVTFAATTDWDIAHAVHGVFRDVIADEAAFGLYERTPELSARRVVNTPQAVLVGLTVALLVVGAILWPRPTVVAVLGAVNLMLLLGVVFKFCVCLMGARYERWEAIGPEEVAAIPDAELPTYTVLVPLYGEANVVGELIANLAAIDYPKDKLEILLLLEEDDAATLEAARAARPPETMRFVIVPDGRPKTKPKACNVGLFFARGEYIVIYDAEDRPEPDQLRKVVALFRRGDDDVACVQAALNYHNAGRNFLTRMFTLEYSYWFDYLLPGLHHLRLPIPLGGTSNHFRTDVLRRLGGWDPFNVTEDADLGIRAAALGYTVRVVNSTTFEEANGRTWNWVRQRSRWIKGYLQTTLVHLRHPLRLVRTAGLRRSVAFALLIGGTPAAFLAAPPLWGLFLYWLVFRVDLPPTALPPLLLYVSLFNLLIGNAIMAYLSMMAGFKRGSYWLVPWALLNPAYWFLHSVAAYKALWQLIRRPHHWEKTIHGLDASDPAPRPVGA